MSTILLEDTVVVRNSTSIKSFKLDEYTRWLCLIEAIAYIEGKADELKLDLETEKNWVQPLALQKYIRERFVSMKFDVVSDLKGDTSTIKVV